ncbi:GNA1162 family protein [Glaciimonas sp. PCH181]|uniref:DUF799 domain-containing protein n=1 Tax=Glaciimonas sp. PCH181 TaxID=2133943 RepID=UPI000D34913C|nr:GNA1162 family protein [Glaciimonas sp. PCH181]PUA20594.1 hypothetical protein C7W93_12880 [Glaciimonas sp. PCH181]
MIYRVKFLSLIAVLVVLSGCVTAPKDQATNYEKFRATNPRSMLIVPVVNRSVDVDAPDYFLSTISRPIAERGYYVFPVNLVKRVMEDDGLGDADMVHANSPQRMAQIFGAEPVMYIAINRWDAKYMVLSTQTTVELVYSLKSGITGEELWHKKETLVYSPQGNSGFIALAIAAAIEKAKPNYMPLAQQANAQAIYQIGHGLPAGPYHSQYLKDQSLF